MKYRAILALEVEVPDLEGEAVLDKEELQDHITDEFLGLEVCDTNGALEWSVNKVDLELTPLPE